MWLLDTARAELHFHTSPQDVTGGYAILSHTWGAHEQSFQDLQAIRKRCDAEGTNPRDFVSPKIRQCCILAESEGCKWVWIDTCCIDKTSSSELSEAITSMFGWYSRSEVCYAFLADVPSGTDLQAPNSAFRSSRWHTRGWTLQELIAPSVVVFLSSEWQPLGTRTGLAPLLCEITLIPELYLTRVVHHTVASIVERMIWAARRRTTRVEDEAYCLMGIFSASIPIVYGEGPKAFQRLQLEVMRHSVDTTLFSWGTMAPRDRTFDPALYSDLVASHSCMESVYLLASSPSAFSNRIGTGLRFTPVSGATLQPYLPWQWAESKTKDAGDRYSEEQRMKGPFGSIELPHFESTSFGVKCHLPIIDIPDGPTIAVLLCETREDHIGLFLHPSPAVVQDHNHQRYNTAHANTVPHDGIGTWMSRLTPLGGDLYDLRFNGKSVQARWKDIYIAEGPPASEERLYGPDVSFLNCAALTPFRVPHWLLSRLEAMKFMLTQSGTSESDGAPLYQLVFKDITSTSQGFRLYMGTGCTKRQYRPGDLRHWAKARPLGAQYSRDLGGMSEHDCATDHIADWPGWSKEVGDAAKMVRMSFTRCRREPQTTLVLHLELEGEVWTQLMTDARVSFPTREELGLSDPCVRPKSTAAMTYRRERSPR